MPLQRGGIRQFRLRRRGLHQGRGRKGRRRRYRARGLFADFERWPGGLGRNRRCGADRAQIAFDRRQAIDHVAERAVNGLERVLRAAVGFRLAEADVGQLALDQIDDAGVHRLGGVAGIAVGLGERDQAGVLAFERTQNIVQSFLDPSEVDGRRGGTIAGGFEALQQIGHALFEMGKRRRVVVAGRDARFRDIPNCRSRPAAACFPASRSARPGAARACRRHRRCRQSGKAGRPWPTACARLRRAAPARRWRRRWRRFRAAPRSRLRAAARSTDRRSNAVSDRAWRRDCGSPRRSR